MQFLRKINKLLISAVTAPVRLYQRYLSPLKGQPTCRFTPTCSRYCIEAIEEWGIVIGLALTVWRVLRCNPFCKGGVDPCLLYTSPSPRDRQ